MFKKEETMIFGLNCGFGLALENLILRASTNTGVTVPSNAGEKEGCMLDIDCFM